jgi:3-oxoacyl-[acyl-carrier protein] reductase
MFELTGLRALVTGATGGIGQGIARALYTQGATVTLSGTNQERLQTLAQSLEKSPPSHKTEDGAPPQIYVQEANLRNTNSIENFIATVEDEMGGIDILINNAGITADGLLLRMSDTAWDDVLTVNLKTPFVLIRSCLRGMMQRRFGRIISIGSIVGATGNAGQANYVSAKSGLCGLMKVVALESASRGITANSLLPGFIDTPMTDKLSDAQKKVFLERIPVKRFGIPDDIASAAVFLASRESSYITGASLHVNGGMLMI